MSYLLHNFDLIKRDDAYVNIEDRGYQFGDGVYEVVRIYEGTPFTLQEHLTRFFRSAAEIALALPYGVKELETKLLELQARNELHDGIIYLQATRGIAKRNHAFPTPAVPAELIAYTQSTERPLTQLADGVPAILVDDIRWLRCDIKSLNLLGNVLAKQQAKEAGGHEAIQHRNGTVTEGSSSNIFIVKQGTVQTHPATHLILNGITRMKVKELCARLSIPFEETAFTTEVLLDADEVFMTSTTAEIQPITSVDGAPIRDGQVGPVVRQLQEAFQHEIL